jgi:hypothetical protein
MQHLHVTAVRTIEVMCSHTSMCDDNALLLGSLLHSIYSIDLEEPTYSLDARDNVGPVLTYLNYWAEAYWSLGDPIILTTH